MDELLDKMICTAHEFLAVAKKMMDSCRQKEKKCCSDCRLIIAFFCRRAVEITESFLILIKENKLPDASILLRSFWEMGIDTDYIFSETEKKEINSLKYLLKEYSSKKSLLEKNKEEFKANGLDVETRLKEVLEEKNLIKKKIPEKYKEINLSWPTIYDRAKNSKYWVIRQAYNMHYVYLCNIEHHDMSFGKKYLDLAKCEPLNEITIPELLRADVNLIMWRGILLEIMKTFNREFNLKWGKVLAKLEIMQDAEYKKMKERDGKPTP